MCIKIGIIGIGNVAKGNYIPFLSKQDDVKLLYYSRTNSKAVKCAETFGGCAYGSISELMAEKPDTVMILTNESEHLNAAEEVLKHHPRKLFFEKPLFAAKGQANVCEQDFFNAQEFLRRAHKQGVETAMNFNYRFFDQSRRLLAFQKEKDMGNMQQVSLFVNYACWSHCIDLLRFFGAETLSVTALTGNALFGGAADIAAALSFRNGAAGTILGTCGSSFSHPLYQGIFTFERGMVMLTDLDAEIRLYTQDCCVQNHSLTTNHSRWDQYAASFRKSLTAYLDSLRNGTPPPVSGMDGLAELQFEAALRRSAALKRPVDIQNEFPLDVC